jgi:hypothetical protein
VYYNNGSSPPTIQCQTDVNTNGAISISPDITFPGYYAAVVSNLESGGSFTEKSIRIFSDSANIGQLDETDHSTLQTTFTVNLGDARVAFGSDKEFSSSEIDGAIVAGAMSSRWLSDAECLSLIGSLIP